MIRSAEAWLCESGFRLVPLWALELPLEQNIMTIALAGIIGAVAVLMIDQSLADSTGHTGQASG